jgi:hypothetical protein
VDVQPKTTTAEGIRIEEAARKLLKGILKESVAKEREYGGVIHRHERTGKIAWTGPVPGFSAVGVDVGQNKKNLGCPEGTKPVAWYHTHPVKEFYQVVNNEVIKMTAHWDEFIDGDKALSDNHSLPGYVATFDGRLWLYTPPPMVTVGDKMYAPAFGTGTWGPMNGKLL